MQNGRLSFRASLQLASDCLRPTLSFALAAVEDPLRLNLPPLLAAAGQVPDAAMLRVMATLYFQGELEQAGIIPVAELLAGARRTLEVRSVRVSRKLEEFADRSRQQWYDRPSRNITFARLFGAGNAAQLQDGTINRDFQQRLAMLCLALTNFQRDYFWGQTPSPTREAGLHETARAVLFNLGPRQYGNLPNAARLIQEQLRAAIDLLNDPDLTVLFQARGMWEVLRQVLGGNAPDVGRLTTRGQTGLRLLDWLASVLPILAESAPTQPLLPADAPAFQWAAGWLAATGIELASGQGRR